MSPSMSLSSAVCAERCFSNPIFPLSYIESSNRHSIDGSYRIVVGGKGSEGEVLYSIPFYRMGMTVDSIDYGNICSFQINQ